jgi:GT2 family glycosyltransferase
VAFDPIKREVVRSNGNKALWKEYSMQLSIILLTWNSKKHVEKCINSVLVAATTIEYEIIVVDNGSSDNTLEIIESKFPSVKIIKNKTNKGVAPARNQGIKESTGEFILILDIDTFVFSDAIVKLIAFMAAHLNIGLCGPMLCFDDGIVQNSFRRFPVFQTKLLRRINAGWAKRLLQNEYYQVTGQDTTTRRMDITNTIEVDYVIGACQMIRRSALDTVGLLDNKIFYGPEDVDICLRLWLKGWKVAYLPDVRVIHYEQRITKNKLLSYITIKHIQGLIRYFVKHRYLISRKSLYRKIHSPR